MKKGSNFRNLKFTKMKMDLRTIYKYNSQKRLTLTNLGNKKKKSFIWNKQS